MFGEAGSVLFACFNVTENRTNRISLLQLHGNLVDLTLARCRHAHDRLVRLDINNFLIVHNFVAGFDLDIDDCCFGD